MTATDYLIEQKRSVLKIMKNNSLSDITHIGVDRSLSNTGVAIIKDEQFHSQLEISSKVYGEERLIEIAKKLCACALAFPNPLVCMESYSYASKYGNFFHLGELGGVIKVFLKLKKIPFIETEPTTLKKYVVGKGNAPKNLIPMNIYKQFKISPTSGDTADAIGCAYLLFNAHQFLKGHEKFKQSRKEAIERFVSEEPRKREKKKKKRTGQLALEI